METARYGRMKLGRCIKYDLGFIGCSADVLALADSMCSGRWRCEIALPNEAFDRINPCLSELKSYLTASYSCVTGLYTLNPNSITPTVADFHRLNSMSPDLSKLLVTDFVATISVFTRES